jgi:2-C-methyl-D-erythritol 4-phosphate cytidylyltransferase
MYIDVMKKTPSNFKVVAIVPAAGLGKRFGPGTNKPFQPLGGKPLLVWSLEALSAVPAIGEIIPVLKAEDMEYSKRFFDAYGLSKVKRIAPGGRERQDSVLKGLDMVEDENSVVVIHDGVRPLVEKDLIENALKELLILLHPIEKSGKERPVSKSSKKGLAGIDGIVLGVPLKDTIKEAEDGIITKTLKRGSLWAIQTPQIFPYKTISSAYSSTMKEGFYSTDDSALVERCGGRVKIIMGSYRNIKITTPEDLGFAEFLISRISK